MRRRGIVGTGVATLALTALLSGALASPSWAAFPAAKDARTTGAASSDPGFFTYSGSKPLASYAPGAVLKTRTVKYHLFGIEAPLSVTQLLYRSVNARGEAIAAVTSVMQPVGRPKGPVIAYQSAYDSLNPADGPSRSIAGDVGIGTALPNLEGAILVPALLAGYRVVFTDTEGPTADFAAGTEYGTVTLDALRAATNAGATPASSRIGLIGYSGGAIGTNWAAALAPAYAPDIDKRLVGAAEGGVLVNPARNLHYIEGTPLWAGVMAMALIGGARAYGVPLDPYLSENGKQVFAKLKSAPIGSVLGQYPGLTWKQLAKPQYPTPESVPVFAPLANKLNMATAGSPTTPMFIGQGTGGELEGTPGTLPGIGKGDGVMVAGDVRSIARQYCGDGTKVTYQEYGLSHSLTAAVWAADALPWLLQRLDGVKPATSNCATIPAGNPLTPLPVP